MTVSKINGTISSDKFSHSYHNLYAGITFWNTGYLRMSPAEGIHNDNLYKKRQQLSSFRASKPNGLLGTKSFMIRATTSIQCSVKGMGGETDGIPISTLYMRILW